MEKKEVKVGNKFIPIEAGGVIPMTEEEWNDFQRQMEVERDYFYMVGNKKYVHYENEDYVRVSDIQQELDKAREEGYQDCMDDIWEEARGLRGWTEHDGSISATDIEAGLQEAYLNIENKLKTKEDGK